MSEKDISPYVRLHESQTTSPTKSRPTRPTVSRTRMCCRPSQCHHDSKPTLGEAEQALSPDELDREDSQASQHDKPARSGKGDQHDAQGDHGGAEYPDHQLEGQPAGAGRPDPLSETI